MPFKSLLAMIACLASGSLTAQTATSYLAELPRPDLMQVLPPPPVTGSPGDEDDRATFRETRKAQGSDRWTIATNDVTDKAFTTFACSMGMQLDERKSPALAHVLERAGGGLIVDPVKKGYARRRPYLDQDLPICEPKTAHLAGNGDYPSGHATGGWATALILAELLPDRATQILARGRAFGESRYICGSHSKSAVEAGYLSGAALVATLHASADFRQDMEAARKELSQMRASTDGPAPARCDLESRALSARNAVAD